MRNKFLLFINHPVVTSVIWRKPLFSWGGDIKRLRVITFVWTWTVWTVSDLSMFSVQDTALGTYHLTVIILIVGIYYPTFIGAKIQPMQFPTSSQKLKNYKHNTTPLTSVWKTFSLYLFPHVFKHSSHLRLLKATVCFKPSTHSQIMLHLRWISATKYK